MCNKSLRLFPYDLDQNVLGPPAIKFAVEDSLPRSEVEFAAYDSNDDFAVHNLSLVMSVPVNFARADVFAAADWGHMERVLRASICSLRVVRSRYRL